MTSLDLFNRRWPTNLSANRFIRLFLIFILFPLLNRPSNLSAQTESPSYWHYSASGRIDQVTASDVNNDGIDEFLVADENGKLDLLSATGDLQWSYTAAESILSIGTLNIDGSDNPHLEIVIGLQNRLILLTINGDEIWQIPLTAFTPPPALY